MTAAVDTQGRAPDARALPEREEELGTGFAFGGRRGRVPRKEMAPMNAWPKLRRPLALLLLPLCLAVLAPSAPAQKLVVGLEKHGKHGSIGIQFGIPHHHAPI